MRQRITFEYFSDEAIRIHHLKQRTRAKSTNSRRLRQALLMSFSVSWLKAPTVGCGVTMNLGVIRFVDIKYMNQYNLNNQLRMINQGAGSMKRKASASCSAASDRSNACCKVESIISVDERGQMVLPKELRDKARIKAGDKLAVTSWEKNGEICCITLIKVEDMVEMVKVQLGPILKEIL